MTDLQWEVENQVQPQPWDDGEVVVTRGLGVLGIFDEGSVRASGKLLASVERGIADVAGVVPSSWSQSVVVYALSNTAFLATLPGLPGGDPTGVDGVAFPVFAVAGRRRRRTWCRTRFVLHPRMLDEAGRARDRLVRHELTHVAIGADDDRAPVWLSEGLAEYVSVQSLPPEKRTISEAAIEAARAGVTEMPPDDSFNDAGTPGRASANYGIAWFACEYLAASFGEVTLWQLLAVLNEPDVDVDEHAARAGRHERADPGPQGGQAHPDDVRRAGARTGAHADRAAHRRPTTDATADRARRQPDADALRRR